MRSHCDVYVSYSRSQEIADKSHSVSNGNSGSNGYSNGRTASNGNNNNSSSTPLANTGSKRPRSPAPSYSGYNNNNNNSSSMSSGGRRDGGSSYANAANSAAAMGMGSMVMPDMMSGQMGGMPVVNSSPYGRGAEIQPTLQIK